MILRGGALLATVGVPRLLLSSEGEDRGVDGASLTAGAGAVGAGCGSGEEVLAPADLLTFFSGPGVGVEISRTGGSFRGRPSSPGEKDTKEQ